MQRQSTRPIITVLPASLDARHEMKTTNVCPCDSSLDGKHINFDLLTIGPTTVQRQYSQILIDRENKRVAPIYSIETGSTSKRRKIASEVAIVVRHYEDSEKDADDSSQ